MGSDRLRASWDLGCNVLARQYLARHCNDWIVVLEAAAGISAVCQASHRRSLVGCMVGSLPDSEWVVEEVDIAVPVVSVVAADSIAAPFLSLDWKAEGSTAALFLLPGLEVEDSTVAQLPEAYLAVIRL
jgi:hypothetical protein